MEVLMDFSDKELRVLLQALYRFRGEVSGASQSEQHKFELVASVIDKIEKKTGPIRAERTGFDREMEESLSVLTTGRAGAAKEKARAEATAELDSPPGKPKVKASARPAPKAAGAKAKKAPGPKKAASGKSGSSKTRS
jgi:hypothetical protein